MRILTYGEEGDYLVGYEEIEKMMHGAIENVRENLPKLIRVGNPPPLVDESL